MSAPARRRDAAGTRQRLLEAARRRFATDGYSATTVRDIADEAGVNVALISRYFTSKEGLFEQCLVGTADDLARSIPENATLEQLPDLIAAQMAGASIGDRPTDRLLLLLRSSGDERGDRIRRDVLRSQAERLAGLTGRPVDENLVLRAEVALCATFGMLLVRLSTGIEPLTSASEQELAGPLRDLFRSLLQA
ncbi:TetR/AcrR family transcriptional regulator [Cryptosporangium phraense]|uniref:TetR/AcrR family transcriptional regulator n=1 Tax=Cryptosporangium phraense TaxID=2593070 RepID=UPI00197B0637|nr:TetR/AcrR family transcriptional regulator [Cryptosporangium phraense]